VLCGNDQIAFGVTRWLAERSLRVGRDVSVVGCDGLLATTLVTPELATLALDFTGYAEKILQAVLEIGKAGVRRESVVFIERGSVGPAP
jgi:LacI family transcriptional regulator